jgi:hypothetical protein
MQISIPLCQSKQVSHLLSVRKIIITKIFGSIHLLFDALRTSCTKSYMSVRQIGLRAALAKRASGAMVGYFDCGTYYNKDALFRIRINYGVR